MPQAEATERTESAGWQPTLLESLRNCGVERERVSRIRPVLLVLALFAIAAVYAILEQILEWLCDGVSPLSESPGRIVLLVWLLFTVLMATTILRLGYAFGRQLGQVAARSAQKVLERAGARRPVFYLRSFQLDSRIGERSFAEKFLGRRPSANKEQKVARRLRKLGPVIAIGRPGERLPALGAARFYVTDDLWHQKVADVVSASQLVLWATGTSEGLRWEISHLIENYPPQKLVLWAHPHLLRIPAEEREAEWGKVLQALGGVFPKPLPSCLGDARFICFTADWTPIPIAPRGRGLLWACRSFFDPLGSALRQIVLIQRGKLNPADIAYRHASRDVAESDFAALIGARKPRVQWSRALAFAVALIVANCAAVLFSRVAGAALLTLVRGDLQQFQDMWVTVWKYPWPMPGLEYPVFITLQCFAEMICAWVSFRFVRDWRWAALLAAFGTTIAMQFVGFPAYAAYDSTPHAWLIGHLLFPQQAWVFPGWKAAIVLFTWIAADLLGLAFAVQRYRPLAKALWVGGMGAALIASILIPIVRNAGSPLTLALYYFIECTVFAFLFWAWIRATSGHGAKQAATAP